MILSFTGHRKIFNQYYPSKIWNPVCEEVVRVLKELKPDLILSGAAIGFDTLACDAALALDIPYNFVIPFKGQEKTWPQKSQEKYNNLLTTAKEVVIVSEGSYSPDKMQIRNHYLIDNSDMVLALYDGSPKSGTLNCINYAKSKSKKLIIIDPKNLK